MARIAIIGAGGVIFAQNFIKDILLDETLRNNTEVVLMDIDRERLDVALKFGKIISGKLNVEFNPVATTDLREALKGADYVITIFRSGTIDLQEIEYSIPKKYGVDQVVADSMGPGGIFRGLRTLKDLFVVLDAMEEICPGAYLLNYVNPMSMNTIALSRRAKTVKVIGLCHSVRNTLRELSGYLEIDPKTVKYFAAGVNHQAFMLKFEQNGKSLYPRLRELFDKPEIYKKDKVRFELMRHFDYFPTESSGHGSEYIPYIRKRQDLIDKFCSCDIPNISDGINWATMSAGVSGASVTICRKLRERNLRQIEEYLNGTREVDTKPSQEYGVELIAAIEKNEDFSANLNVMNNGLIPSLPPGAAVEVPCLVNGAGILPCRVENYPEQLASLNRGMINAQILAADGALTGCRHRIFQAIACDPLTAAALGLDEIQAMTDEMFEALKDYIDPRFSK